MLSNVALIPLMKSKQRPASIDYLSKSKSKSIVERQEHSQPRLKKENKEKKAGSSKSLSE